MIGVNRRHLGMALQLHPVEDVDVHRDERVPLDSAPLGATARTGSLYASASDRPDAAADGLIACIPLKIGDRVTLYQGVTLGALSFQRDEKGALVRGTMEAKLYDDASLGGKIYGIEPGNDGNRLIQSMIDSDAFGLKGFEVVESSEQGMLAQVARATKRDEHVVFLGWEPHPMNANLKMTYLTGGDDIFG